MIILLLSTCDSRSFFFNYSSTTELHTISTPSPSRQVRIYVSSYRNSGGVASAIAAALPAAIGGIPTKILGAVSAFLAIEAGWLAWADNQCGNIEAFINGRWLSIGINNPWVKTAC
jgi:hypothetical protein